LRGFELTRLLWFDDLLNSGEVWCPWTGGPAAVRGFGRWQRGGLSFPAV
jgi:hypothetical protein